jgi:O-antigen/teichoic acid export membrane protein
VKTPSDYHKYAFITAMGYSIANIISFFNARNLCRVSIHTHVKWKEHLKPILIIFSMTVATTIFVDSDITILGFFKGDYEVGLYSVSVKIYKIVKTLLASVLTVSVPRLSNLLGNGKKEEYTSLFIEIFKCMMTLVFPAVLGVFIMSENIVCLVAGTSYVEASGSLKILSLSLLVCMFGWMYNSCVLIPHKKEKKVLVAVVASAVLNISLNLVLIPIWGQLAAATTTFLSEGCSMILCMYYSRKLIKIKNIKKNSIQVLIGSLAVFAVCMITKCMGLNMVVETFVAIIVSVVAYAIILLCLKNEMAISVFQTVKNKVL